MRRSISHALACSALTLVPVLVAACTPDGGPESAGRAARELYAALAARSFARAHTLMHEDEAYDRLEARFGSIEAWASRLTKNGIVSRTEVVREIHESDGARVELVVLFNDGTRRHDQLELVRTDAGWRVDLASVPGAPEDRSSR